MADETPRSVPYRALDYIGFSFFLVVIEEYGRSFVPSGGPTMPWVPRIGFLLLGTLLLWLGGTGPKIRELLSNWLSADVKRENEKLRAELAALTIKQIPNSNQVPTVTSALRPVYTLGFDYLPAATPLQRGWKQEYNNDGVAEFDSDPDIPGSLRMKILKSEVAIHHNLPPHATLADHLEYTAKYAITTMIFARLIVSTRDGSVQPKVDFKFRYGRLQCMSTNPNPNPGDPSKWLPEQTISWPAEQLAGGRLAFNIDLREAVKVCLGSQGWVFKSIEGVRVRGNTSISPIVFGETTI